MKTLALLYDAAGHDRKVDDLDKVDPSSLGPEQLLWVDVSEFDDGQSHGLPPHLPVAEVSLEELGSLQIFDDHYRFAIPLHDEDQSQLGFVVGKTWLLTLSKVRPSFFDDFVHTHYLSSCRTNVKVAAPELPTQAVAPPRFLVLADC